jgi:CheY-like chemotaxis protein
MTSRIASTKRCRSLRALLAQTQILRVLDVEMVELTASDDEVRSLRQHAAMNAMENLPLGAQTTKSRRLLIVEDNADVQYALRDLLELLGHQVCVASDGASGVEVCMRELPEIALIDIGLPGLDGYSVARQIRAAAGAGYTPILVALTGYGSAEEKQRALTAGFDIHLVKPVWPDALDKVLAM